MSQPNLKQAFVKWKLLDLVIETKTLYWIDAKTKVCLSHIYSNPVVTSPYNTKMNVIYEADEHSTPKRLIKFNETFEDKSLDNWRKKYNKTLSNLMEFNGR